MTILLDTNIIMDALQDRSPFDIAAKEILQYSQNDELTCGFTANTTTDIFYLFSKARDLQTAHNALSYLLEKYEVVSVTKDDCVKALKFTNRRLQGRTCSCLCRKIRRRIYSHSR